ncbi:MAG: hypothetical protein AMS24_02040 [Chlamydiae bacterium SM23_39]|nr:MAG: hypothetical protein AMS24_02040 [Chlamydiae bacterium SM23_39]
MKKIIFILSICSSFGFSALPPLYQNSKEIKKILNDNRLYKKLGSDQTIENITKSEKGWIITTPKYTLKIDVEYLPKSKILGPVDFKLHFQEVIKN